MNVFIFSYNKEILCFLYFIENIIDIIETIQKNDFAYESISVSSTSS